MATVGAKNQPLVQTTDTFNPVSDINTLANWVANNYASFKILTGSTVHTSLTGADLFAGLVVWENSTSQFWQYSGTSWSMLAIGSGVPSAIATQTGALTSASTYKLVTYNSVTLTGGITHSAGIFTVPVAGKYLVSANISWASDVTATHRELDIDQSQNSGSTWNTIAVQRVWLSAAATEYQNASAVIMCNAGDQLRVQGYNNVSGGTAMTGATIPLRTTISFLG